VDNYNNFSEDLINGLNENKKRDYENSDTNDQNHKCQRIVSD
jgi:hypothetical protein